MFFRMLLLICLARVSTSVVQSAEETPPTARPSASARSRPNFVFFLVDDLGWGAMSATGSKLHETPHFDALCARGMRFTQAYAACTVCSPSRAAILTGQYPGRTNLTDWIPGHVDHKAMLKVPDWKRYIDHRQTTLPEALQQGGYRTGFFGKWHLMPLSDWKSVQKYKTPTDGHTPQHHGFDVNVGGREWGHPKGKGKYFYPFDMPGLEKGEEDEYLTDRLTDEALNFLDQSVDDEPFLLYMSYYTVHGPLMAKPDDITHFTKKLRDQGKSASRKFDPATYAAMHKSLDESVGRIVAKLQALGELENTVILFTGDNGGDYNSVCGGLRGFKGFAFEGGVREPTCIVWPGVTEPGSVCDTPILGTDFFPTMLAMADLPAMPQQHLDGKNLEPLLTQTGPLDREALFWHYPHYHRTKPYGAIRQGDWKLIEFFEEGELMLFNLKNDPQEQHDLAGAHPEQTQRLLEKLKAWRAEVDAQMPSKRLN